MKVVRQCPICDSSAFVDFRSRRNTQCADCGSLPRHRAMWLFLRDHVQPQADWRVLHLAPDEPIARMFIAKCNDGYEPSDLRPRHYAKRIGRPVNGLDLVKAELPANHYDLVVHSHVLEHIPFNATLLLQRLHRAIKPGGVHLFALPVWPGTSREDLDPAMPEETRKATFGHKEHLRRFGRDDFDVTIGPVLGLTSAYTLEDYFSAETLIRANIRKTSWRCSGASVFMVRKTEASA